MEVEPATFGIETDAEMTIDYGAAEGGEAEMLPVTIPDDDEVMQEEASDDVVAIPEAEMVDVNKEGVEVVEVEAVMGDVDEDIEELPVGPPAPATKEAFPVVEDIKEPPNDAQPPLEDVSVVPVSPTVTLSAEAPSFVPSPLEGDLDSPNPMPIQIEGIASIEETEAAVQKPDAKLGEQEIPAEEQVDLEDVIPQVEAEELGNALPTTNVVSEEVAQLPSGSSNGNGVQDTSYAGELPVGCTCSASTISRPILQKSQLASLDITQPSGSGASAEELTAPTVLLSYNNSTYSLFRRHEGDAEVDCDSSLPVLMSEAYDHALYYDTLEVFIDALRESLAELREKQEELILAFLDIGIQVAEDNIYTSQISLADFDRLHVGCGLPGRLHITIETAARLPVGFNALVQHVMYKREHPTSDVGGTESTEDTVTDTVVGDESAPGIDGSTEEGDLNESIEEGELVYEDDEWDEEANEGEQYVEEESDAVETNGFGLESEEAYDEQAIADLNDEDFEAVIEGIEEDFVESEKLLVGGEVGDEQVDVGNDVIESGEGEAVVVSNDHSTDEGGVPVSSSSEILPAKIEDRDDASSQVDSEIVATEVSNATQEQDDMIPGEVAGESFVDSGNPTDVVIDYDEVFDERSTPAPSPLLAPTVPSAKGEPPALTSIDSNILGPKRGHSALIEELGEDGETKRPRLSEPLSNT